MLDRVLILDYGGVLGDHHQEPAESTLASALGVTVSRCRELLSEKSEQGRAFRENAISEAEFWNRVAALAGLNSPQRPVDAFLSRLWAETYRLNNEVLRLLTLVRQRVPVGVLTNIDSARSRYLVEVVEILRYIDIYLPSYRFKLTKYSPNFWHAVAADVQQNSGTVDVFYVDDREQHVRACGVSARWHGLLYRNITQFEGELQLLGFLPNPKATLT